MSDNLEESDGTENQGLGAMSAAKPFSTLVTSPYLSTQVNKTILKLSQVGTGIADNS